MKNRINDFLDELLANFRFWRRHRGGVWCRWNTETGSMWIKGLPTERPSWARGTGTMETYNDGEMTLPSTSGAVPTYPVPREQLVELAGETVARAAADNIAASKELQAIADVKNWRSPVDESSEKPWLAPRRRGGGDA